MKRLPVPRIAAVSAVVLLCVARANATEGGGSIYPAGAESYTCCALPPPGTYGIVYGENFRSTTLRDNAGEKITLPGFKVNANAVVPRFVYIAKEPLAGASIGVHAILPIVDLKVEAAGASQHKTGIGDITVGTALGWHHSPTLHTVAALDVFVPTGRYDKGDLANVGRNHWALQPIAGLSYIDPAGLNADAKVMYTFNARNKDTDYRSGQELIVDYAAGWGIGGGFVVGFGGYLYRQTTDDRAGGRDLVDNKGRSFAIGPALRYDNGKGTFATLKYQVDSGVRNRAEGKALWLKVVFPL